MSKSWFVPLNRNSSRSSGAKGETDTEVHALNYKMEMEIEIWKSRGQFGDSREAFWRTRCLTIHWDVRRSWLGEPMWKGTRRGQWHSRQRNDPCEIMELYPHTVYSWVLRGWSPGWACAGKGSREAGSGQVMKDYKFKYLDFDVSRNGEYLRRECYSQISILYPSLYQSRSYIWSSKERSVTKLWKLSMPKMPWI